MATNRYGAGWTDPRGFFGTNPAWARAEYSALASVLTFPGHTSWYSIMQLLTRWEEEFPVEKKT